jgi:Response regulator containing CheY-like receiver, AAA-type ATPase, and DNA-binding domains
MIKMMLEYKGYSVAVSERAEQANEILKNDGFDLIIMDMLLSGVNGTDLCSEFKKDSSIAHIPVIMISAHPNAKESVSRQGLMNLFRSLSTCRTYFQKLTTSFTIQK